MTFANELIKGNMLNYFKYSPIRFFFIDIKYVDRLAHGIFCRNIIKDIEMSSKLFVSLTLNTLNMAFNKKKKVYLN